MNFKIFLTSAFLASTSITGLNAADVEAAHARVMAAMARDLKCVALAKQVRDTKAAAAEDLPYPYGNIRARATTGYFPGIDAAADARALATAHDEAAFDRALLEFVKTQKASSTHDYVCTAGVEALKAGKRATDIIRYAHNITRPLIADKKIADIKAAVSTRSARYIDTAYDVVAHTADQAYIAATATTIAVEDIKKALVAHDDKALNASINAAYRANENAHHSAKILIHAVSHLETAVKDPIAADKKEAALDAHDKKD